jgi:hypothetical protein
VGRLVVSGKHNTAMWQVVTLLTLTSQKAVSGDLEFNSLSGMPTLLGDIIVEYQGAAMKVIRRQRQYRFTILLVACALFCFTLKAHENSPLRVLFIGNSYTYFNNLPELFTNLARAGNQRVVEPRMIAPGGWRLKDHWEKGEARKVLHESKWDVVVLQEQSTLGVNYYVDGMVRIAGDQVFRPYAEKWISEIQSAGSIPMLYLTWARKATPKDQAALSYAYVRAGKDFGAQVAPVGTAWEEIRKKRPSLELYYRDGSHPSPAGSYLAACALYAAIFHRSPVGLPGKISGVPVNLETGIAEPTRNAVLADLSSEQARVLQDGAWHAYQNFDEVARHLVRVPMPEQPALPKGDALTVSEIEGRWKGVLNFYPPPFSAAEMEMTVSRDGTRWKGHLTLRYHSNEQPDQSLDLDDLQIEPQRLSFTDPKAAQNLTIRFHGVKAGRRELRGHAEATSGNPESPVRLLGTWQLKKTPNK